VTAPPAPVAGKLVIAGVGLIGASFALALRAAGCVRTVVGVGRSRANLDAAQRCGAIDRGVTVEQDWTREAADADVVLLATPVAQYPALLSALCRMLGPRTIVTDAGSTKQDVVAAARATLGDALPRFVPAHPIAGSDRSGAVAADAALFRDRQVIVTPLPDTDAGAVALVTSLWQAAGARVAVLTPERHDGVLAAVSHLPHVLAFVLMDVLAGRRDAGALLAHAGSGLRDVTRIAGSSPEMWRDIALANRVALGAELDAYRHALDGLCERLACGDGVALEALFARAAGARRRWAQSTHFPSAAAGAGDDDA
jgi:prephenate dehydrogenase